MKAFEFVMSITPGLNKTQIQQSYPDKGDLLRLWLGTWESLGVLVYKREIEIDVIDDYFSGPIVISWNNLKQFVFDERKELNRETMHEWFQWLAERMIERESKRPAQPAHLLHTKWKA